MKAERETVFAAWLINIGRFYQEGPVALVRKCQSVLARYMDVTVLAGILSGEAMYSEQRKIVDYSLDLSLCESEKKEKLTNVKNLTSVFSRVTVKDAQQTEKRYYPLLPESVDAAFPLKKEDIGTGGRMNEQQLETLSRQFEDELLELKNSLPDSWEKFIIVFDSLARKYMWCITASDYEGEDISLYNQSRIAAAIAECVIKSGGLNVSKPFKLVLCDFTGIQKYVFSVANVSESGVAKRLRARSFYVDITVSVLSQVIIERFGLTQNHILLLTGGKFYLLLSNTQESEELLESIECEVEARFFDMFKGKVAIHLAWLTMGREGLENYSKSVLELSRQLSDKKAHAFNHVLTNENGWNEERFLLEENLAGKRICTSCGSELTDSDKSPCYCENCRMQTEIGGKLPGTRYISYYKERKKGSYPIYGDYSIGLWRELKDDDAFLIEKLNGNASPAETSGLPVRTKYMANHIPTSEAGEVMTFSDIASHASGRSRLAVLKADVDNLGYIFADGLRKGSNHFGTISRLISLSRFLEILFSGYINRLISGRSEYRDVYSVFSGGDDLFLIGPWDVMPKLAVDIAAEFRRFTANNASLTISATVSVFQPKEHIANLAEISEQTLKSVKDEADSVIYPEKSGRDGVCFMGNKYTWEDLREQLAIGDRLSLLVKEKLVDTGMLRRIAIYSRMYRKFLADNDVMSLMFEPLFHYDRQRNYEEAEKRSRAKKNTDLEWFLNEYVPELTKNAADSRVKKNNLYFSEAVVQFEMDKTKEERN
ncbi:MAG: type III-A CRISPR-associated protein Cas10/Csm1 [Lachnospiraceae bacterium]|nr:type III-A CRISPR-associated protein Cas10/Csm1 [Lachnospiraceae bacterium]